MNVDTFRQHLRIAAATAVHGPAHRWIGDRLEQITRTAIDPQLAVRYYVLPTGGVKAWGEPFPAWDGPPLPVYDVPADPGWIAPWLYGPLAEDAVVALLCRRERVPHWIDVCEPVVRDGVADVVLLASMTWTGDDEQLWYRPGAAWGRLAWLEAPPFHLISQRTPFLPAPSPR